MGVNWYGVPDDLNMPQLSQETISRYKNIPIEDEEYKEWCKPWRGSLMVSVMGKRVGFKIMETTLNRTWAKTAAIKIIDMPQGYFFVFFNAEADYKRALFEGPWRVTDHYILVQRWRPTFMATTEVVRKVAVWIQVPDLPH